MSHHPGCQCSLRHGFDPLVILAAIVGSLMIAASIFLCYGFADRLVRFWGAAARRVIAAVYVSAALHRSADPMERGQRAVGCAAF